MYMYIYRILEVPARCFGWSEVGVRDLSEAKPHLALLCGHRFLGVRFNSQGLSVPGASSYDVLAT